MLEKIKKILEAEGNISLLLNNLYEYELFNNKYNDIYDDLLKSYSFAVEDERKLFSIFSPEDINKIKEFFLDKKNKDLIISYICSTYYSNNFPPMAERLIKRFDEIANPNLSVISFANNIDYEQLKDKIKDMTMTIPNISIAIERDFEDIYLSFLDEYIKKVPTFELKKALIKEKYDVIFNSSSSHEQELIKRKFDTEYSVYLSSELSSVSKTGNYIEPYNKLKKNFTIYQFEALTNEIKSNEINKANKIINYFNNANIIIIYLKMRAILLIADNQIRQNLINIILRENPYFVQISKILDENIEESLDADLVRHKTLSIRKK